MKKILLIMSAILLLNIALVFAHEHDFAEAKRLIDSKIGCNKLTDEQLESIGEYYMEKMHPGESHDLMHRMMGIEEGTKEHKQFHINMAKTIYCEEENAFGSEGIMGGRMMNMMMSNMMGYGMMGSGFGYPMGFGYWNFINILYTILLIGLIILVYFGIIKLWRSLYQKKAKK